MTNVLLSCNVYEPMKQLLTLQFLFRARMNQIFHNNPSGNNRTRRKHSETLLCTLLCNGKGINITLHTGWVRSKVLSCTLTCTLIYPEMGVKVKPNCERNTTLAV